MLSNILLSFRDYSLKFTSVLDITVGVCVGTIVGPTSDAHDPFGVAMPTIMHRYIEGLKSLNIFHNPTADFPCLTLGETPI